MGSDKKRAWRAAAGDNFNPRSPHGERRDPRERQRFVCSISIHAPRMGSDASCARWTLFFSYFNPRSPHGERRFPPMPLRQTRDFNPRSPHGERRRSLLSIATLIYFNPRSPHGERPLMKSMIIMTSIFQSTLPAWGATCFVCHCRSQLCYFNPRSPHGERLSPVFRFPVLQPEDFNPRSPHGERLSAGAYSLLPKGFQSTLPAWGATKIVTTTR